MREVQQLDYCYAVFAIYNRQFKNRLRSVGTTINCSSSFTSAFLVLVRCLLVQKATNLASTR